MYYEKTALYEDREDVTLTSYILDDSPELLNGGRRGAVLVCPGGAYISCSDREGEAVALKFASMGYHAFVLRYSVYGNVDWFAGATLEPKSEKVFPQPMRDIGKALEVIGMRSGEWLVDTNKIALCGFSAGAHNCAMYSVYWNKPEITDYIGGSHSGIRPCAAVLGYTLSDYLLMKEMASDPKARGLFAASNTAFLGNPDPDDELLLKVSPARLVDENTPPMFIWTTAGDHLVPAKQSLKLAESLADQGIPYELHIFEEGEHGLSLADQATAGNTSQIMPDAAKWTGLADAWLKKRMALFGNSSGRSVHLLR